MTSIYLPFVNNGRVEGPRFLSKKNWYKEKQKRGICLGNRQSVLMYLLPFITQRKKIGFFVCALSRKSSKLKKNCVDLKYGCWLIEYSKENKQASVFFNPFCPQRCFSNLF